VASARAEAVGAIHELPLQTNRPADTSRRVSARETRDSDMIERRKNGGTTGFDETRTLFDAPPRLGMARKSHPAQVPKTSIHKKPLSTGTKQLSTAQDLISTGAKQIPTPKKQIPTNEKSISTDRQSLSTDGQVLSCLEMNRRLLEMNFPALEMNCRSLEMNRRLLEIESWRVGKYFRSFGKDSRRVGKDFLSLGKDSRRVGKDFRRVEIESRRLGRDFWGAGRVGGGMTFRAQTGEETSPLRNMMATEP
jgi:hypothetical protein